MSFLAAASRLPRPSPPLFARALSISTHYSQGTGRILPLIIAGLQSSGVSVPSPDTALTAVQLRGVDQFHIGGVNSALALFDKMGIKKGDVVVDIGSGLGGPARLVSERFGCSVVGVDLCEEFVAVAKEINVWTRSSGVEFRVGDGSSLEGMEPGTVDSMFMLHVGMNVEDKVALGGAVGRGLKEGGVFGVFDMVAGDGRALDYPVPFATEAGQAFLSREEEYVEAFEGAGLSLVGMEDKTEYCLDVIKGNAKRAKEKGREGGLGPTIVQGKNVGTKMKNIVAMFKDGRMRASEMIFEKKSS